MHPRRLVRESPRDENDQQGGPAEPGGAQFGGAGPPIPGGRDGVGADSRPAWCGQSRAIPAAVGVAASVTPTHPTNSVYSRYGPKVSI